MKEIHALSIKKALTPEQWKQQQQSAPSAWTGSLEITQNTLECVCYHNGTYLGLSSCAYGECYHDVLKRWHDAIFTLWWTQKTYATYVGLILPQKFGNLDRSLIRPPQKMVEEFELISLPACDHIVPYNLISIRIVRVEKILLHTNDGSNIMFKLRLDCVKDFILLANAKR